MRLIDADKLMKYALNQKSKTIGCNDIARFPTAYDVDNVVEQLDKEINQCFVGDCYEDYDEFEEGRANAFREAIKIVKGGGRDE